MHVGGLLGRRECQTRGASFFNQPGEGGVRIPRSLMLTSDYNMDAYSRLGHSRYACFYVRAGPSMAANYPNDFRSGLPHCIYHYAGMLPVHKYSAMHLTAQKARVDTLPCW